MKKVLVLTGWGLPDYAAAAAATLRAFPEADVLGASQRRLSEFLLKAGKGREDVYILGVALHENPTEVARVVEELDASGTTVTWISARDLPSEAASLRHCDALIVKEYSELPLLTEAVGRFFRIDVSEFIPYATKTERKLTEIGRYQELFRAAGYVHRNRDDDTTYATAIRYLSKPLNSCAWAKAVKSVVDDFRRYGHRELLGSSPAIRKVSALIAKAAKYDSARVLILGDSGTGKETVAQQIHQRSSRREMEFVPFNCASVTPNLLEGRLFGYEKGAYTGADRQTDGLFGKAKGGTLFLDEIGELPMEAQGLLLRVLEEGKYQRLGGTEEIEADVRLITATNRDLPSMVREGAFRRDLFQRLCVIEIRMPSLREHKEDIPAIANDWWIRNKGERLTETQVNDLMSFDYDGNVRELINLLERALVLEETNFKAVISEYKAINAGLYADPKTEDLNVQGELLENVLKAHVRKVAQRYRTQKEAAKALGIAVNTMKGYL